MQPSINFDDVAYQSEYLAWKARMVAALDAQLKEVLGETAMRKMCREWITPTEKGD